MKKMNICFFLISSGWGGAENVVYHLIKTMGKKDYSISIILNEETYPYFKNLNNVFIYNIGPIFSINKIFHENFHLSIPTSFLRSNKLSKIIKMAIGPFIIRINFINIKNKILIKINDIHPDIIHFHNPVILQFCSYFLHHMAYPTIYTSHGIDFGEKSGSKCILKDRKKRRVLKRFNMITVVSNYLQKYLISKKVTSEIKVIYNGIDETHIQNILKSKPQNNNHEVYTLLFPGGQKKQKGGELLLQAIKIVNAQNQLVKLYYCGYVNIEFKIQHKNKDVIFTGLLPYNEYLELLSKCDCLTLLPESEAFSISILEAMAFGKTILCTSAGGIPELIIDGVNGFFVERDPNKIAEKIFFLLNNQDKRMAISINNIRDARKFQWDAIVDQYIQTYESIIQ